MGIISTGFGFLLANKRYTSQEKQDISMLSQRKVAYLMTRLC
jgi:hypothetical protein